MNAKSVFKKISFKFREELKQKLSSDMRNFFTAKSQIEKNQSALGLFICLVLCWLFDTIKWTKSKLAGYYRIGRDTLNKWVDLFCHDINLPIWKAARFINAYDLGAFFKVFGYNEEKERYEKKRLCEICGISNYQLQADYNFIVYRISRKIFNSIDVFPPKIARKIIYAHLGNNEF